MFQLSIRRGLVPAAILFTAAGLGIPSAALAEAPVTTEIIVRHVPTRGLDLANAGDLMQLRNRVRVAVRQICGEPSMFDLEQSVLAEHCRRMATLSAEPQIAALVRRDTQYAAARAAAQPAG